MAKRRRKKAKGKRKTKRGRKRWSQRVTETSDALTLEQGVFKKGSPRAIALSLKRSADRSKRRKSDPYRSAMSMLVFYINRAGKGLSNDPQGQARNGKGGIARPLRQGLTQSTRRRHRRAPAGPARS